eukprot:CAMPEP_0197585164 /NCGR_PEP_ID=MMETSP1326-20131121/7547_1 /TAXON_ID=1155430 /ORGANISM="Genus nov. species nov., Strain RCC2288" /LENGTH=83 /DNA_ID=CAMNT_0043149629 /DNA_START=61 /DNA_END=312 /DNA_ORIENTATION=+
MSSAAAANSSAYWRLAGMSYLKYSNMCAEVVRGSLKEPFLTKAKPMSAVYYKQTKWSGGKPAEGGSVITEVVPEGGIAMTPGA